jgi:hypothetical protein
LEASMKRGSVVSIDLEDNQYGQACYVVKEPLRAEEGSSDVIVMRRRKETQHSVGYMTFLY